MNLLLKTGSIKYLHKRKHASFDWHEDASSSKPASELLKRGATTQSCGLSTAHLQYAHFCWIHSSLNYRLKCGQRVTGVFSFSLLIVIHSLHAEHSSVRLPVVAVLSVLCVSLQFASGQHQSRAKWAVVARDFTCNSSGEAARRMVKKDSMNSRNRQKITKKITDKYICHKEKVIFNTKLCSCLSLASKS